MRRLKAGDRAALEYLYVSFAGDVCRHVAHVLGDRHEAEDVTQNVFAKLPESIRSYEERGTRFASWLFAVARNAALDESRRRRPVPTSEIHDGRDAAPSPELARSENVEALTLALRVLPDEQRTVLLLRHLAGLSPGEIADRLGKSTDAVHCLHHRGRDSAKATLTRLGSAPATRR